MYLFVIYDVNCWPSFTVSHLYQCIKTKRNNGLTCSVSEISDDLMLVRKSRWFRLSLFDGAGSCSSSSLNTLTSSEAESVSSDWEAFLLLVEDELEGPPAATPDDPPVDELAIVEDDVKFVAVPGILFIHIPNLFTMNILGIKQLNFVWNSTF